jgi:DNA-binding NarL/FixJ family response regulator
MNVLLVDDDEKFRANLKKLIEDKFNQTVFEAENGALALELLGSEKIDLIFLDYEMPLMNAFEFLKKFRLTDQVTPVIICTSHNEPAIVKELIPFRIKDYIIKADVSISLIERLSKIFPGHGVAAKLINVLIIEDDSRFRSIMKRFLEKELFSEVAEAADGEHGLELVKKSKPDLIFLDYLMPNMNGIQFLEKLRMFNKEIPVVLITSYTDKKIITELLSYKITDFLVKADMITKLSDRLKAVYVKCGFRK